MVTLEYIGKERCVCVHHFDYVLIPLVADWSDLGTMIFEALNLLTLILLFDSVTTVRFITLTMSVLKYGKCVTLYVQDTLQPVAYHFGGFYGLKFKHCLCFYSFKGHIMFCKSGKKMVF